MCPLLARAEHKRPRILTPELLFYRVPDAGRLCQPTFPK
jgi:hypothetical protein